jgi:hypothetical protein
MVRSRVCECQKRTTDQFSVYNTEIICVQNKMIYENSNSSPFLLIEIVVVVLY